MNRFIPDFKGIWLWMLEPPWRQYGKDSYQGRPVHWAFWLLGWAWTLSGLMLGALVAPTLVKWAGLANSQYQGGVVIAVAAVAGILVQVLGFCCFFIVMGIITLIVPLPVNEDDMKRGMPDRKRVVELVGGSMLKLALLLLAGVVSVGVPFAGVAVAIYGYFNWIGAGQRAVTIAFVGALLVKTLLIPAIKAVVTGAGLKWFMRWLRGDKVKTKGA